jgi:hypothetical protein
MVEKPFSMSKTIKLMIAWKKEKSYENFNMDLRQNKTRMHFQFSRIKMARNQFKSR